MRFSAESDEAYGERNLLSAFAVGRVTQETDERRHMSSRARSQVALHSSPGHTRPRRSTPFHLLLALAVAASTATVAATARADTVDLAPVADTSVGSGTEATWDHGASDELEVEQSPVHIAYLKFDLSAVRTLVVRATLTLFCTDGSLDGGTVYPVSDSSWVEGNQTGNSSTSANGPGLKWTELDTNADGKVDARDTSPFVPDFTRSLAALGTVTLGQTVTADVTAAMQAGAGLYTVAIKNGSTNRAKYSSRESQIPAQRPRLRLELDVPTTTTTTTSPPTTPTTETTGPPRTPT